jgi:hypothetical protein
MRLCDYETVRLHATQTRPLQTETRAYFPPAATTDGFPRSSFVA